MFTRALADFSRVAVIWGSDDLGFRSGTLTTPQFPCEKILPWHARCAEIAHSKGKPCLLHSCRKIDDIMEDLVTQVGVDGKHSFGGTILPVTEAKRRWDGRSAILGEIDMDFLCRSEEAALGKRMRGHHRGLHERRRVLPGDRQHRGDLRPVGLLPLHDRRGEEVRGLSRARPGQKETGT